MSNKLPLVCICMPTYNTAGTVREALESILAQTYPNLVVHVLDNASIDNTLTIIESIADPRITIHRHDRNIGGVENVSRCIQQASGKYTAIFHADDVYEPYILEKQVAFLEAHHDAGAVFTEATLIDASSRVIGDIRLPHGLISKDGLYDFSTIFKAVLRHYNFLICPSFMVRTQVYRQEIRFVRGNLFGTGVDLDIWLRILQKHSIGHIPNKLMRYRISSNQGSAQIREGTDPADFFLVIDHYLAQKPVQAMINADDLRNYKWLERRDRVGRALNLFLTNRPQEAGRLLSDIYSQDALRAAFRSKRGLLTLVIGVYVKLLITMGLNKIGKTSLTYIKQVTHR